MSRGIEQSNPFAPPLDMFAADAALSQRLGFLRKVYLHVFGAILLLVGLEAFYFTTGIAPRLLTLLGQTWWITILLFLGVSWFAERLAYSGASAVAQYSGLGIFVVVQSLLLAPLLAFSLAINPDLIGQAGFLTLGITGGLTFFVVVTKKDFSFLRNALFLAGLAVFAISLASLFWGFSLGLVFSVGVVVLMCGYILYETSLILHHLPVTAHVAGALMIFSSIAVMFRQILMILIRLNRD
jgi:FtsH-binding integral membrane protein